MTTRERRERRRDKRRDWAEGRSAKADAAQRSSAAAVEGRPFGEPIHVGHHSERRVRNAIKRSQDQMGKAIEHRDMATRHTQAADTIDSQLERSVFNDDVDAVEKLRERIALREAERDQMKARNAEFCKLHKAKLKELTPYQRDQALPHQGFELTNLGSSIRRDKKRLASLEAGS